MLNFEVFTPNQLQIINTALQITIRSGLTAKEVVEFIETKQNTEYTRQVKERSKIIAPKDICPQCGGLLVPTTTDGTFKAVGRRNCRWSKVI